MKDYIYIEDLALICYKIIISAKSGIFNIGTGVGTKINQILDIIKSVTNMTPKIDYLERKLYDVPDFILDISKSKSITGNFDFLVKVIVKDIEDYENFILTKLSLLKNLGNVQTHIALSEAKNSTKISSELLKKLV